MFYFLLSCVSFFLLSKSFSGKSIPPWKAEMKLFSAWVWGELFSNSLVSCFKKSRLSIRIFLLVLGFMPVKATTEDCGSKLENFEGTEQSSLLDLPELVLDSILERLSPAELCSLSTVCSSLRDRCRSDHLWEKHMKNKWGKVIGEVAHREWRLQTASGNGGNLLNERGKRGHFQSLVSGWFCSWIRPKLERNDRPRSCFQADSIKSWYLSLESGKLWFPAQVFNRENGRAGFMLSCYDANVCYDSETDTFQARYSPFERLSTEEYIQWGRLRAPPIDTPSFDLHVSDCLNDLKPGDHIEIQWRRNKEFPYGWWYGVVGHMESCTGDANHCHCHCNDTVILDFNQYCLGSRWRRTTINRKGHREEGNETYGFYAGIRKLYKEEEIAKWNSLWPSSSSLE